MRSICSAVTFVLVLLSTVSLAQAAPVTFILDPSRSEVTWSTITVAGTEIPIPGGAGVLSVSEQGPGSFLTSYSGTVETDVDLAGNTIEFLGGSNVVAANSGTWLAVDVDPIDSSPIAGPANYGLSLFGGGGTTLSAIFDLILDLSGAQQTLVGGGTRTFSSTQDFDVTQGMVGSFSELSGGLGGPTNFVDMNGQTSGNVAADGTLTALGGGEYELTLPVGIDLEYEIDGFSIGIGLTGELVATAIIPEPATLTLASFAVVILPLAVWRSRRMSAVHRG